MASTTANNVSNFRNLPPDQRRQVASAGGRAAQAKGTAHRWTPASARAAALKAAAIRQAHKQAAADAARAGQVEQ